MISSTTRSTDIPKLSFILPLNLAKIDELKIKAEKENGEAQMATVQKNESHQKLITYCSDLRACLDLFYEGSERQTLEQVGIRVR